MSTSFRKRLLQGDLLSGTIISLACPSVAEILSQAGFDWLFIDGEHGPLSAGDIQLLLQAAKPHCPCVVRAAASDGVYIRQVLDAGADGVIAPLVNDADTAARVVASAKYPPMGKRSVGIARAHGYGAAFGDYVARANDDVAVIIQVEHIDAVANIDAILDVPGIDAIFIGPYDLSSSMGKPGRVNDADVVEQIETVRKACLARQMPLGIFGVDAGAVKPAISAGYRLIATSMDTLMLIRSSKALVDALKG